MKKGIATTFDRTEVKVIKNLNDMRRVISWIDPNPQPPSDRRTAFLPIVTKRRKSK